MKVTLLLQKWTRLCEWRISVRGPQPCGRPNIRCTVLSSTGVTYGRGWWRYKATGTVVKGLSQETGGCLSLRYVLSIVWSNCKSLSVRILLLRPLRQHSGAAFFKRVLNGKVDTGELTQSRLVLTILWHADIDRQWRVEGNTVDQVCQTTDRLIIKYFIHLHRLLFTHASVPIVPNRHYICVYVEHLFQFWDFREKGVTAISLLQPCPNNCHRNK